MIILDKRPKNAVKFLDDGSLGETFRASKLFVQMSRIRKPRSDEARWCKKYPSWVEQYHVAIAKEIEYRFSIAPDAFTLITDGSVHPHVPSHYFDGTPFHAYIQKCRSRMFRTRAKVRHWTNRHSPYFIRRPHPNA